MNSLKQAREKLRMSQEEFALLLGWRPGMVAQLEKGDDEGLGMFHSFAVVLAADAQRVAHVLIEHRIAMLPPGSPQREALMPMTRKILGLSFY